jgi:hypothetical protein
MTQERVLDFLAKNGEKIKRRYKARGTASKKNSRDTCKAF